MKPIICALEGNKLLTLVPPKKEWTIKKISPIPLDRTRVILDHNKQIKTTLQLADTISMLI